MNDHDDAELRELLRKLSDVLGELTAALRSPGEPYTLEEHAVDTNTSIDFTDQVIDLLEARVSALEEITAARWPRRTLVRHRLARELRGSVAGYRHVGPGFATRRAERTADDLNRASQHRRGTP